MRTSDTSLSESYKTLTASGASGKSIFLTTTMRTPRRAARSLIFPRLLNHTRQVSCVTFNDPAHLTSSFSGYFETLYTASVTHLPHFFHFSGAHATPCSSLPEESFKTLAASGNYHVCITTMRAPCILQLGMVNEFDLVGRPYVCGATPRVRSVCLNDHSDGRKILVGTSCSEVRTRGK